MLYPIALRARRVHYHLRLIRYADAVKSGSGNAIEREIKLRAGSAAQARGMLRGLGYPVHKRRVFEQNLVLDDANASLRGRGLLLRVRAAGRSVICTFKKKEVTGRHKSREEHEFEASSLSETLAVFEGLGYREAFRYEKYRTEFSREGEPGHVMLDETPMGTFLELEGTGTWIDRTAKALGYRRAEYVTESYGALWEQWCVGKGWGFRDMRF
jgi:adenylate cyclase, class 2